MEERPEPRSPVLLVTVTHKGAWRDVLVPHTQKKALVAADTGHIVGIVGAGYKVFTNQQAVTLCHKFCLEAFPDTTPAEWTFVEGQRPGHPELGGDEGGLAKAVDEELERAR